MLILLMVIGASPGSCGGGIKTTTMAAITFLVSSRVLGHQRPQVFKRTISDESTSKAVSVALISIVVVIIATMVLLMTELGGISHDVSRGKFLEILFEVVSAFGTVGLSTGITSQLSIWGKLIITFVMFAGRLGPLLIVIALSRRKAAQYYYAEEGIMIG